MSRFKIRQLDLRLVTFLILGSLPCSTSIAQESGPDFRYDPSRALRFEVDAETPQRGLSPDGSLRAVAEFKKIRVLSAPGGDVRYEFPTPNHAMAPTFSPDQKQLVYADCTGNLACDSVIYARHLESGKRVTLGNCYGIAFQFAFSGDGKRVAVVSMYGPILALIPQQQFQKAIRGEIAVFDLTTTNELMHTSFMGPTLDFESKTQPEIPVRISLDQNGSTLLVAASPGIVKIIDVRTHNEQFSVDVSFTKTGR
ncbi:MAG: hypothetical protein AAFU85_11245 [Planctomycetota bacterium]